MPRRQEIATKQDKDLPAIVVDDAMLARLEEDELLGSEEMTQEDIALPFLVILQPLSPQVQEGEAKYIEGAKAGMLYNTVTQELFDVRDGVGQPIDVVVSLFRPTFIEWVPRTSGGGFVAQYTRAEGTRLSKECSMDAINRPTIRPNGNQLIDTNEYFLLQLKPDGEHIPAMIAMSSASMTPSKKWNARIKLFTSLLELPDKSKVRKKIPQVYQIWPLSTFLDSNDKGTWWNWKVGDGRTYIQDPELKESLYVEARQFHDAITAGDVKIDHSQEEVAREAVVEEF